MPQTMTRPPCSDCLWDGDLIDSGIRMLPPDMPTSGFGVLIGVRDVGGNPEVDILVMPMSIVPAFMGSPTADEYQEMSCMTLPSAERADTVAAVRQSNQGFRLRRTVEL